MNKKKIPSLKAEEINLRISMITLILVRHEIMVPYFSYNGVMSQCHFTLLRDNVSSGDAVITNPGNIF